MTTLGADGLSGGTQLGGPGLNTGTGDAIPSGDWILATGFWDDAGVWRNDQVWID